MTKNRNRIVSASLSAAALFVLSGYDECGPPALENNGFDLWCGDELCYWKVERGSIRKASTWHAGDFGVELEGDDVSLFQESEALPQCLRLSLVADVAADADVTIAVDADNDGVVEVEERIPTAHWAPIEYQFDLPPWRGLARVLIQKRGDGHAVLAQVRATAGEGCELNIGELCVLEDDTCDEGVCGPIGFGAVGFGTCGECVGSSDCRGSEACGLDSPADRLYEMHPTCGARGRHGLGERCLGDDECATDVCNGGICSTCADDRDCDGGRTCAQTEERWGAPWMCSPGDGFGPAGEPCHADADCSSGACSGTGTLEVCSGDGRLCTDNRDCDAPETCIEAGIAGGTCQ